MVYKEQQPVAPIRIVEATAATSRDVSYPATPVGTLMVLDVIATTATQVGIARTSDGAADATWVQAAQTTYSTTNHQTRRYFKASDGSEGSVRVTSVSVLVHTMITFLNGWEGVAGNLTDYSSIFSQGNNASTGTSFPFSGFESAGAKNGVALSFVGLSTNPSSWTSWSTQTPIPANASDANGSRFWHAIDDYTGDAPDTTVRWSGSRTIRYTSSIIPLAVVASGTNYTANPSDSAGVSDTVAATADSARTTDEAVAASDAVSALLASGLAANASDAVATSDAASVASMASRAADDSVQMSDAVYPILSVGGITGNTVPTQAEMPAAPFDLYPAPTMTWGAGQAPSGAGYISVAPSNPLIRLTGPAGKGTQAGSLSGFVNPAPLQDISGAGTGTNPLVYPPYGIRIATDYREVYFRLGQRSYAGFSNVSARAASRLKVNGKWTSLTPVYLGANLGMPSNPDNLAAGEYWFKIVFPTTEMREIELVTHLEFGGVVAVEGTGANSQTPAAPKHRLVVFDGSLPGAEKHQTGNFALSGGSSGTYTAVSSYIWYAAQILAYDDVINAATGSSGYAISGDTVSIKSTNKIPRDGVDHNPATVIVGGPNNDIGAGRTAAQVSADLDIILPSINTSLPNALRIIEGGFTAPAMGSQASAEATLAPFNDAIKSKAQQYGFWFVNPTTGQTYDPQGTLRKTTANWVYQDTSSISSDNTHPTQDGSRKLGIMLADAVVMAHPAGSTATDYTAAPADQVGGTDSATVMAAASRGPFEAVANSDAAVTSLDAVRATSDAVALTDVLGASLDASRATTDAASAADGWSVVVDAARSANDAVAAGDTIGTLVDVARSSQDAVSVVDAWTVTAASSRSVGDNVGVSDAASAVLGAVGSTSDAVSAADAWSINVAAARDTTDAVLMADTVGAHTGFSRVTSDLMSGVDAWMVAVAATRALTDPVVATDTVSVTFGPVFATDDVVGVGDVVSVVLTAVVLAPDVATVNDAIAVTRELVRGAVDAVVASDTVSTSLGLGWFGVDVVGLADQVSVYLAGVTAVVDAVAVAELVLIHLDVPPPVFRLERFMQLERREPPLTLTRRK